MNEPTFHLENIIKEKDDLQDFEGPLNLILILLSKNKVEINDIQIADILDQYLAFIVSQTLSALRFTMPTIASSTSVATRLKKLTMW